MKKMIFNRYSAVITTFVIGAIFITVFLLLNQGNSPTADKVSAASFQPEFSFDGAGSWVTYPYSPIHPSNRTSLEAINRASQCLLMVFHRSGRLDNVATKLEEKLAMFEKVGDKLTPYGTKDLQIRSSIGAKQYELHQYADANNNNLAGQAEGQEFGYIPLASGYLDISATCQKVSQLPSTIPALQAIKFYPTN